MPNGNISRQTLRCHEIHYEEDVYQAPDIPTQPTHPSLPDHVDAVREALLSFENTIPEGWKKHLHDELAKYQDDDLGPTWTHHPQDAVFIPLQHYERSFQERSAEHNTAHKNMKRFQEIANRARELLKEPEPEWSFFWRSDVFLSFNAEARKQSGFHPKLDAWSIYESVLWNEFESLLKPLQFVNRRTQPKPDLTYGFPIQDKSCNSPKGLTRDDLFQTLSLKVLGGLIPHKVSCVPTTGLRNWTKDPEKSVLRGSDRFCFPWAVVEMKRYATSSHESIERCYCQAANAAAAALELQSQLFDILGDASPEPPPVVAFTCVGPIVKVWLAYQYKAANSAKRSQRMICIWSTSVRMTWGVASLRCIVLNMHMWASRVLKPKIQACIYQVSRRLKSATPYTLLSVNAGPSDKRLCASGLKVQRATSSFSTKEIENAKVDIIDLTQAFESSKITDAFGRPVGHDQHFDCAAHLKEGTKLFSGFAHESKGRGLFGNSSHANKNTGLLGSSPHEGMGGGLFGASPQANTSTSLFGGSAGYTSTKTGLFGSSSCTNTGKSLFGDSARPSTRESRLGGSSRHDSPNRRPFGRIAKLNDDSDHGYVSKRPAAALEATGKFHRLGTADVAFTSYKEGDENYQTITCRWPYRTYSLEELRLADYGKGNRYDGWNVQSGDDQQSVDTDNIGSEEDSNFDRDDDTYDHYSLDDSSCLHSNSEPEEESGCDEDLESDTCDPDPNPDSDSFDGDTCTSNSDYWDKLDRDCVIQALLSRPVSGERRIDWFLLNSITRGLCAEDRAKMFVLANKFRNPNGTCSVPLELVIRLLDDDVEEIVRID
ncbi:hypothetical protein DE146DRAFT_659883 [Phaeosphaeria sp. MPI-PUGE-AT-0046c]|nr:hypothetical protein DE146DRAFT_659883 [Phaeosphaeria sp. MPI-PUGE-AT-0046c]